MNLWVLIIFAGKVGGGREVLGRGALGDLLEK